MKYLTPLCLLLSCILSAGLTAGEVILAADGKATATIVVGEDDAIGKRHSREHANITYTVPSEALAEAARDLAWHLNEMAGLMQPKNRIKVVDTIAEARTRYRILLGDAAIEAHGLQAEAATIPYPAYVYQTIGNDLLIYGSSSKGAANGVYGFLQDELGVRWFAPHKSFTVVPREDTVAVANLYEGVEPSFPGRLVHVEGVEWPRRMRMGDRMDEGEPFRNTSHNFHRIFRPDIYGESNPEYYAMRAGKRQDLERFPKTFAVCYSNPEVVDIATQAALAYFRRADHHHSFALGINDGRAYCECEACVELQPDRTFRGEKVASDMYYHFVNQVARRVAEEFPDRYLGVIAYNDVKAPPLGDVEDNVHVVLVNDVSEYFDPDYRASDEELVSMWEEKGVTMGLYYYTQLAKLVPAHFPRLLNEELKDKHDRGFTSVTSEFGQGWPWHGPMSYAEARLLWDVDLDVDALLDEYFTQLYGPAAPHMQEMYALFEDIHMRPRSGRFLGEHYHYNQFRPYTAEDLEEIEQLLAAAHASLGGVGQNESHVDRDVQRRLGYVSNGLRVFRSMLEGHVLAAQLEETRPYEDEAEVLADLENIGSANTLLTTHEATYREAVMDDSDMPGRYYRDTAIPVRNQWKNRLSSAAGDALVRIHHAVREGDIEVHDQTLAKLDEETRRFSADEHRGSLFRYHLGELTAGENKVVNPGFESSADQINFPPQLEWGVSPVYGWAFWQRKMGTGNFDVSGKVAHSGANAGRMRGIDYGCFITLIEGVRAGETYHMSAWVKNTVHTTREAKPVVTLDVWWLDADDKWTQRRTGRQIETGEIDRWIELEQVVRVPENAVSAAIMIYASDLHDDEEVFVDDVSFRLLSE